MEDHHNSERKSKVGQKRKSVDGEEDSSMRKDNGKKRKLFHRLSNSEETNPPSNSEETNRVPTIVPPPTMSYQNCHIPHFTDNINFRLVKHGECRELLNDLINNVYSVMLPNMPRDYIREVVLERNHISLIGTLTNNNNNNNVICGATFQKLTDFVELDFVAVCARFQIRSIGTVIMTRFKDWCIRNGVSRILTNSDNFCTGFFKKQGFSENISIPKEKYYGILKSYEKSTLMECMIQQQQRQQSNNNIGQSLFSIQKKMMEVIEFMESVPHSWPFRDPVDAEEVKDYYDVIKLPMDLKTLKQNVEGKYQNNNNNDDSVVVVKLFHEDMMRIFKNCREYNQSDNTKPSSYIQCADDCEKKYLEYIQRPEVRMYNLIFQ